MVTVTGWKVVPTYNQPHLFCDLQVLQVVTSFGPISGLLWGLSDHYLGNQKGYPSWRSWLRMSSKSMFVGKNHWKIRNRHKKWVCPKIGGTPKSSILIGFSIIFTIHFGAPLFLETPKSTNCLSHEDVASKNWLCYPFVEHPFICRHVTLVGNSDSCSATTQSTLRCQPCWAKMARISCRTCAQSTPGQNLGHTNNFRALWVLEASNSATFTSNKLVRNKRHWSGCLSL